MENFNLDNFDPTTAQLRAVADSYAWLTIAKDWEETVRLAKRDLQSKRVYISKTLKSDRDKAIKYQKDNIAKEKELIAIISPVEKTLDEEIEKKEMEEEMKKRRETLDIRWEELKKLWLEKEYTEEYILTMNFMEFMDFIRCEKARLFEIENEKKIKAEAEEKRLADLKEAEERWRIQAEQKAKEEADKLAQKIANKDAEERAMKEQAEIQAKLDKEAEEKKAQEEKEKLEKATKYKNRLKANWYTEENKSEYQILVNKEDKKVTLWKYVSEFKI